MSFNKEKINEFFINLIKSVSIEKKDKNNKITLTEFNYCSNSAIMNRTLKNVLQEKAKELNIDLTKFNNKSKSKQELCNDINSKLI